MAEEAAAKAAAAAHAQSRKLRCALHGSCGEGRGLAGRCTSWSTVNGQNNASMQLGQWADTLPKRSSMHKAQASDTYPAMPLGGGTLERMNVCGTKKLSWHCRHAPRAGGAQGQPPAVISWPSLHSIIALDLSCAHPSIMPARRGLFEPAPAAAWPRVLPWALMALAACGWAYTLLRAPAGQPRGPPPPPALAAGLRLLPLGPAPQARAPTLVVYVFSGSDPEYADNLRFFVGEAVKVRPPARRRRRLLHTRRACPCWPLACQHR